MNIENVIPALIGGVLIGLASALPLWWHGRIAGASGLMAESIKPESKEKLPGLFFISGLILGSLTLSFFYNVPTSIVNLDFKVIVGALIVGYGARLGGGCTSGHGICGMGRLSKRSIFATIVFLVTAVLVANTLRSLQ